MRSSLTGRKYAWADRLLRMELHVRTATSRSRRFRKEPNSCVPGKAEGDALNNLRWV
jgi:hypothetical protein